MKRSSVGLIVTLKKSYTEKLIVHLIGYCSLTKLIIRRLIENEIQMGADIIASITGAKATNAPWFDHDITNLKDSWDLVIHIAIGTASVVHCHK